MESFATVDDLSKLWRKMTVQEQERAQALLPIVSDSLRVEAERVGRDLDNMLVRSKALRNVAKAVTCDICARVLMTSTDQEPTTQFAQSAGGYSVSGTFLVPGGGIFIKKAELARLGLRQQKIGVINYDLNQRAECDSDCPGADWS